MLFLQNKIISNKIVIIVGRVWSQWNLKIIVWGIVFLMFIETWQIKQLIEYKEATD